MKAPLSPQLFSRWSQSSQELDTFGLVDVTGGNQVPGPHLSSNSQWKGLSSPPDTSPQENRLGYRGIGSKLPTPNSGLLHTKEDAGGWQGV